jgi:hypothetical protein
VTATLRSSLHDAVCEEWLRSCGVAAPRSREVAHALIASTRIGAALPVQRRGALAHDGTRVEFSVQMGPRVSASQTFRLLVEPGALSLRVSEQIDCTLQTLGQLFLALGWSKAADSVNSIVRATLPSEASAVDGWWGGMGLGCALAGDSVELRGYCNVRDGDPNDRWQRIARAIGLCRTTDAEAVMRDILAVASPCGAPAGLAFVVRDDAVLGVRVYVALSEPRVTTIAEAASLTQSEIALLTRFAGKYEQTVGPLEFECVTLGYDVAVGMAAPALRRVKVDFDLARLANISSTTSHSILRGLYDECCFDYGALDALRSTLIRESGGFVADYIGLGFRSSVPELTTYARPA